MKKIINCYPFKNQKYTWFLLAAKRLRKNSNKKDYVCILPGKDHEILSTDRVLSLISESI